MNRIDFLSHSDSSAARHETRAGGLAVIDVFAGDLPCPWCGEATAEADASCRGCGRRFG